MMPWSEAKAGDELPRYAPSNVARRFIIGNDYYPPPTRSAHSIFWLSWNQVKLPESFTLCNRSPQRTPSRLDKGGCGSVGLWTLDS